MGRAVLEVRDLWVGDGPGATVQGVSFTLGPRQVVGILGGPGAGKSRLLRCIGLDFPPSRGGVYLRGEEITAAPPERRRALRAGRIELVHPPAPDQEDRRALAHSRARALVPAMRPATVPMAGMRQRIQIAKALSTSAEVLLLDEPLAGVDTAVQARIRELLRRLRHEVGTAVVLATRDPQLCRELAHEVLVLDEGAVSQRGPAGAVPVPPAPGAWRRWPAPSLFPRGRRSA